MRAQEEAMESMFRVFGSKALLALLLILFAESASAALEQEAAWSDEKSPSYGTAITTGDVNCDGTADLIVGQPQGDPGDFDGNVRIWFGGAQLPLFFPDQTLTGTGANTAFASGLFGAAVATGDVNGDGCDDLVVGSPRSAAGPTELARVEVFLSGAPGEGLDLTPAWTATGFSGAFDLTNFGQFGASVATGDFDGDGI